MAPAPRRLLGLPATVISLGIVSFFADVSGELLFAVLPFFVASTGGGALAVALAGSLGDAVAQFAKVGSGYLSDTLGKRKALVVTGYGVSAATKVLLAFATFWPVTVGLRAVERVGKGLRGAPRDALIAETVEARDRGRAFGLHRAMDSAGSVAGVLIALALVTLTTLHYDQMVLLSGFLGLLALIPFLWIREPAVRRVTSGVRLRLAGFPPRFRRYMVVAAVFGLGNVTVLLFMLRSSAFFPIGWEVSGPIMLYLLFNAAATVTGFPAGVWADRVGRPRALLAGFALFALAALGFALALNVWAVTAFFAVLGVAYGIVDGTERAVAVDLAGEGQRGTALGAYATVTGLASVGGGLAAGLLWQQVAPWAAFAWAAALAGAATVLLAWTFRGEPRAPAAG